MHTLTLSHITHSSPCTHLHLLTLMSSCSCPLNRLGLASLESITAAAVSMAAAVSTVGKQVDSVTVSFRVVDCAAAGAGGVPGDPEGADGDRGLDLAHDSYQGVGSIKALCTGTYLLILGSTLISCTLSFTCSYPLPSITSYTLSQAYYHALSHTLLHILIHSSPPSACA